VLAFDCLPCELHSQRCARAVIDSQSFVKREVGATAALIDEMRGGQQMKNAFPIKNAWTCVNVVDFHACYTRNNIDQSINHRRSFFAGFFCVSGRKNMLCGRASGWEKKFYNFITLISDARAVYSTCRLIVFTWDTGRDCQWWWWCGDVAYGIMSEQHVRSLLIKQAISLGGMSRKKKRRAPTDVQTQNQTLIIPHEHHELPGGVGHRGSLHIFSRLAASSLVRFFFIIGCYCCISKGARTPGVVTWARSHWNMAHN
jgi:hypothetical protein